MRDRFRAFAPSMLLWQFAAKQFHVNRMIIYDQTGADHIFTTIRTSIPIPGDGDGSCVALALLSSQLEISCGDVDPGFCVSRSSASILQLRMSFGQRLRSVSGLSKKSVPTIVPQ